MLYSIRRRHNSPSIPQTPYQTLIIPCPNFDPIYQVILLESSNEWNLSPTKEGSLKKEREEQGLKRKRGETSVEKLHVLRKEKKERMKFTSYWRDYQKKERKKIAISYSAKSDVWPHPYPHIICICTTFYSLTFSFLTPIHYTILCQQ
jgi:hypothetical protein